MEDALADAEKRGGHLATITSEDEWHAINRALEAFHTVITLEERMKKLKAFGNGSPMKLGLYQVGKR